MTSIQDWTLKIMLSAWLKVSKLISFCSLLVKGLHVPLLLWHNDTFFCLCNVTQQDIWQNRNRGDMYIVMFDFCQKSTDTIPAGWCCHFPWSQLPAGEKWHVAIFTCPWATCFCCHWSAIYKSWDVSPSLFHCDCCLLVSPDPARKHVFHNLMQIHVYSASMWSLNI